jgi:ribonuclease HII
MQIARADATLIISGIEGSLARMRRLEDSKSLTDEERRLLEETIEAGEHALASARKLFASSGVGR